MTKEQYREALKTLGLSVYASGDWLGISMRQSQRYASGEAPIPQVVANLLDCFLRHGLPPKPED